MAYFHLFYLYMDLKVFNFLDTRQLIYKAFKSLKLSLRLSVQNSSSNDYVNIDEILLQCTHHVFTFA